MFHHQSLTALEPWMAAFGLSPGVRVETDSGPRPAGELRVGDLVQTRDDGFQPLTEVRHMVGAPAERNHYPVWIGQGALGFGLPHRDIELGPQHRVLFQHIRVSLMMGEEAVLTRAKSLVAAQHGVAVRKSIAPASFVHLALPKQGLILAEGLPVESVLPDGASDLPYATIRSWELLAMVA